MPAIRVLYIENSPTARALVKAELSQIQGYTITLVSEKKKLLKELKSKRHFDTVLSGYDVPGLTGSQVIEVVNSERPELPVVIVSATSSEARAIEAMERGAADYVSMSPGQIIQLHWTIKSVLERQKLLREMEQTRQELSRFFDLSHDCLIVFDKAGVIRSMNPAAEKLFQALLPGTLPQRASLIDLLRPEASAAFREQLASAKKDGVVLSCILQTNERFGDRWLELNATWMAMTSNYYGVFRDISDRRHEEMKRQEAAVSKALLGMLSKKEMTVLRIVVEGVPNKGIARRLEISEKTVERHRSNAMKKLKLKSLPELVRMMMIADTVAD